MTIHDDPRYQQAAAKLGELQTEATKLRERLERVRHKAANSGKVDAKQLLAGTFTVERDSIEAIERQLEAHLEAIRLQEQALDLVQITISREACQKAKPRHDALLAKVADSLKAAKAADKELYDFTAELDRQGVRSTFPVLALRAARTTEFGSIADWLRRYQEYVSK